MVNFSRISLIKTKTQIRDIKSFNFEYMHVFSSGFHFPHGPLFCVFFVILYYISLFSLFEEAGAICIMKIIFSLETGFLTGNNYIHTHAPTSQPASQPTNSLESRSQFKGHSVTQPVTAAPTVLSGHCIGRRYSRFL